MTGTQSIPLYIVDAFTVGENEAFTGNTASILLLNYDDDITDDHKQKIAAEMNTPITVFASRHGWSKTKELNKTWAIRWFSAACEVQLCGHGTLAASKIIFARIFKLEPNPNFDINDPEASIKFESKFGTKLAASISWSTNLITLDLPANTASVSLSLEEKWVQDLVSSTLGPEINAMDAVMDVQLSRSLGNMSIYLHSAAGDLKSNEAMIKKIKPDWAKMLEVDCGAERVDAVLVSIKGAATNEGPHYFARVFLPWKGVNEDPVTGSAQTMLGPYWKKHLELEGVHLKRLNVRQMSERGGQIIVTLEGNRVKLTGSTNLVFMGEFLL